MIKPRRHKGGWSDPSKPPRSTRRTGHTGFACPKCDGPTDVKDSRQDAEVGVNRRRQCRSCGHRFSTKELPVELSDSERQQIKLLRDLLPRLFSVADLIDELKAEHE